MWLSRLRMDVRPEERRNVLGAFLMLGGFMAGHALLETARDALFLARLPARQLPWVYLAIALLALVLTQAQGRLGARRSVRNELSLWLVWCAAVTLSFWFLVGWAGNWIYYALYVWSGTLATLVVVRFWIALGALFSFTQAKRLFAVIGSGSVLGAIAGSGLAVVLAEIFPSRYLVVAAALVFLAASGAPRLIRDGSPDGRVFEAGGHPSLGFPDLVGLVWGRPYLRRVAILIGVSTITFTLVDYVFKSAAGRFVPPGELDEFFSGVYLTLNILSLAVQLALVPWLLRRFGVHAAQSVPPLLSLVGSSAVLLGGGLPAVLLLKGADGATRHSLNRTVTELLFVSLPEAIRSRVKGFIDVVGQRGGQALASIAILAGLAVSRQDWIFPAATMVFAGLWLRLAFGLKRHYLNVFRETLHSEITQTRIDFPALDLASFEALLSTLNDPDDSKVLAALDLLAEQGKVSVIPALILYHPSAEVVLRALELLADSTRDDFVSVVERLLQHSDPEVRAAALRLLSARRRDEAPLRASLSDPSPLVRATGLVGLVSGGYLSDSEAEAALRQLDAESSVEERVGLARAIGCQPSPLFLELLGRLAASEETPVRLEALRAMAQRPHRRHLPAIIDCLAVRELRPEAVRTLESFGGAALPALQAALASRRLPHSVRRHLPRAMVGIDPGRAAAILQEQLLKESDGMIRFKILRALGRLRNLHADLKFDEGALRQAIQETLEGAFRLGAWRRALQRGAVRDPARATAVHEVLVNLLLHKQSSSIERIFRLLNLLLNNDELSRVHRGLMSRRPEARSSSRELLDHLVPSEYRLPLLELLDDLDRPEAEPSPERREKAAEYEAVLAGLLDSGSDTLSCLAAYHAGELGLSQLRESLRGRLSKQRGLTSRVIQHAINLLTRSGEEKASHGR